MSIDKADKNFNQLKTTVKKALIGTEMPLKAKHVRATILSTYNYQSLAVFWSIAVTQPIMVNQITAWKFTHLLHKILRDGHNLGCQELQHNIMFLNDLGKYWSHVKDGYGLCILQYTKLLVAKIEFHIENPRFSGTLKMSDSEIEEMADGDLNAIFQLTIEIFDYLDALMLLQTTIFISFQVNHASRSALEKQCRLAALIPCIEDANALYRLVIQFMPKLHENLSYDILDGHRQRFSTVFGQLKTFYRLCEDENLLTSVITIPKLSNQLPNFSPVRGTIECPMPSAPPDEGYPPEQTLVNF